MIPQESGYRSISTISIRKFDRLAGELQWIDGEVFGKTASVNADTGYMETRSVGSGTCHGVIIIRKGIINIFL